MSPLAFLLKPFQSAPVRAAGRVLSAVLLLGYFKRSWQELRQVEWPNRKDTTKLTFAVFVFAVVFSLIIAATDYGLDKVFRKVLIK
jgi:preprotein translocase SecE subunit